MIKAHYDRMKPYYCYSSPYIDKCTLHSTKITKAHHEIIKAHHITITDQYVMKIAHHIMTKAHNKITKAHHTEKCLCISHHDACTQSMISEGVVTLYLVLMYTGPCYSLFPYSTWRSILLQEEPSCSDPHKTPPSCLFYL